MSSKNNREHLDEYNLFCIVYINYSLQIDSSRK